MQAAVGASVDHMKTKMTEVRKPLRENRNIPDFMVRQIAEECSDSMKRLLLHHINMTNSGSDLRRQEVIRMNAVLKDLTKDVKNLLDNSLNEFLNRSTR